MKKIDNLAEPRNIRLTKEQEKALDAICNENFNMTTHIRMAVDEYLKKFQKPKK